MNELVITNKEGRNITTSLIVAEIFHKSHDKVCRDIQKLTCSEEFSTANFGDRDYIDSRGKTQLMYELTKDGFSFLVMGYTGEKAGAFKEKFINEFNNRETLLSSDDYIISRALNLLQTRTKELEATNKHLVSDNQDHIKKIEEQKPKVAFADSVIASKSSILIRELAVILKQRGMEIGQNRLFQWMRDNHYLCTGGESYNQPTQRAMELDLFEIKKTTINQPDGHVFVSLTTKVSAHGQIYFINKLLTAA